MSDQAVNALIATGLGMVAAIVLLIPTAAVQYRLDGRLEPRDLAILLSGAVYGLALWTYTLLPMPVDDTFRCKREQLAPFGTIRRIGRDPGESVLALVNDPAFLQVALNVLLFVPMGYYVRQVLGRGVVVATALGLGTSLLIEVTQATGVWHLYGCAYRKFDVDDLLINTLGATVGSLLAALFVRRRHGPIVLPTRITFGRRLVGMVCDVLFMVILGAVGLLVARGATRFWLEGSYTDIDPTVLRLVQWGPPALVQVALVLLAGRTVGELVVSVRAVARRRRTTPVARLVKLAAGVGPLLVLGSFDPGWTTPVLVAYLVVTAAAAWPTRGHRGLSHLLAGMDLEVAGVRNQQT